MATAIMAAEVQRERLAAADDRGRSTMGESRQMAAQDLPAAAVVDVAAALSDPAARPWGWEPFGADDRQRQELLEAARIAAECEFAVVETVEHGQEGQVTVYTDQINLTVPAGYLFTVQAQGG